MPATNFIFTYFSRYSLWRVLLFSVGYHNTCGRYIHVFPITLSCGIFNFQKSMADSRYLSYPKGWFQFEFSTWLNKFSESSFVQVPKTKYFVLRDAPTMNICSLSISLFYNYPFSVIFSPLYYLKVNTN